MYKVLGVRGDIKYKYKYYANSCFVEEKNHEGNIISRKQFLKWNYKHKSIKKYYFL